MSEIKIMTPPTAGIFQGVDEDLINALKSAYPQMTIGYMNGRIHISSGSRIVGTEKTIYINKDRSSIVQWDSGREQKFPSDLITQAIGFFEKIGGK